MAFIVTKVISYRQNFKDRNRCILMKNKASADNGNAKEKIVIGADHKDDMDQRVDKDKDHFLICMAFIVTGFLIGMAFIVNGFLICMAFIVTGFLGYACAVPHYVAVTFEELVMTNHHWALSGGVSVCSIVSSETYLLASCGGQLPVQLTGKALDEQNENILITLEMNKSGAMTRENDLYLNTVICCVLTRYNLPPGGIHLETVICCVLHNFSILFVVIHYFILWSISPIGKMFKK